MLSGRKSQRCFAQPHSPGHPRAPKLVPRSLIFRDLGSSPVNCYAPIEFQEGSLPATAQKSAHQSARQQTIKILYGESDQATLSTQAAEIGKAGHQVTTALNRQGVLEALRGQA